MHLLKRLAGVSLAFVLMISVLPCASARQFYSYMLDSDDGAEIASMLNGITAQTFSGTDAGTVRSYVEHFLYSSSFSAVYGGRFPYTNAQGYWSGKTVSDGTYSAVVSATGCFAYCKFVSQVVYGTVGTRRDLNERAGRITGAGLKTFLETYAQAGEHIRVDSKHSVTFVSGTENGFYYMDYAGDQNPRILLRYSSYDNFAARCNELGKKVWLYDASTAVNSGETAAAEPEEDTSPASWVTDYVEAAQELGLSCGGEDINYNGSLTMAETVTFAARMHSLLTVGGVELDTAGAESWYAPYAQYLMDNGILTAEPDYSAATTREQFVSLMYAAVPEEFWLEELHASVRFADAAEIVDLEAVEALYCAGVLTGVELETGTHLNPTDAITRSEALALLVRLVLPEFRV